MPTLFSQSKKRKILSDVHLEKIVHTYNIDIAPYEESQSSSQCMRNMSDSIDSVEAILRYKFNNRSLLEAALTHSSYTESESYQRLELLGDAVVGLVITIFFYLAYPDVDPAQISLLRSANISTEKLARVAVRNGLYKYVRHKTILLNDKVRKFLIAVEDEDEMVVHGGQMKAPKVLADIVESVVGAVYVDCGFCLQSLWTIIRELLEPMVMLDVLEKKNLRQLKKLGGRRKVRVVAPSVAGDSVLPQIPTSHKYTYIYYIYIDICMYKYRSVSFLLFGNVEPNQTHISFKVLTLRI